MPAADHPISVDEAGSQLGILAGLANDRATKLTTPSVSFGGFLLADDAVIWHFMNTETGCAGLS